MLLQESSVLAINQLCFTISASLELLLHGSGQPLKPFHSLGSFVLSNLRIAMLAKFAKVVLESTVPATSPLAFFFDTFLHELHRRPFRAN